MVDFLIVILLLIILGAAIIYIVKAKKSGARCVGCPDSGSCAHAQNGAGSSGNCGGNCADCNGSCGGNTKCSYHKERE